MAAGFLTLRINQKRLDKALKLVPQLLAKELRKAFIQHGLVFYAAMHRRRPFKHGTGKLLRSIRSSTQGSTINTLRMVTTIGGGVASRYAGIQEFGGTIKGKPWLTIPLPDNLTAAGVPRFKSARALMGSETIKTFLALMPSGKLLIGRKMADKSVRWLWVLKHSVKLKPRLGFFKTWLSRPMRRDRAVRFNKAIVRALKQGTSG